MKCETNPNNCPIEVTLSLIGGKYKPVILWFLIDHPLHYAELQRLIPKATPKMLSQPRPVPQWTPPGLPPGYPHGQCAFPG